MIKKIITYIKDVIGLELEINPLDKTMKDKLPFYLNEGYQWYNADLAERPCLFAEMKEQNAFGIAQMEKHFHQVKGTIGLPVVAVFDKMEAYNRKRFIERKMAFVVPGKQLYLPDFLIDLQEFAKTAKKDQPNLTSTAQQLLLAFILDQQQHNQLEHKTFKELATLLSTNPMAITRAVENLKSLGIIEVTGDKEKFIRFGFKRQELLNDALKRNILLTPVIKRVYVDEIPLGITKRYCNLSALPEYSDINPSRQEFLAIEKTIFYALQKSNALVNVNANDGHYCLEVWKYNPDTLVGQHANNAQVVDPLSLYLSLKDNHDERIEMALEQLINRFL